jgi:hypothetical protein
MTRKKTTMRPQPLKCAGCGHVLSPWAVEGEAAAYTRRATQTLRNLRVRGGGPPFQQAKPGGIVTYAYVDLDAWMRSMTRYSTSDYSAPGFSHPSAGPIPAREGRER